MKHKDMLRQETIFGSEYTSGVEKKTRVSLIFFHGTVLLLLQLFSPFIKAVIFVGILGTPVELVVDVIS